MGDASPKNTHRNNFRLTIRGPFMLKDDDYFDLPEDEELAFLQLEKECRELLERRIDNGDNNSPFSQYYQEYINSTLAAARGLGLKYFDLWETPTRDNDICDAYRAFSLDVARHTMQIRIRHSRRAKRYSVALDAATKQKIRHHLEQLKELAEKLEISTTKREAVLSKILALEMELERERTRFEVVASFILEAASIANEVGEKLEPWRRWVDSIAGLLGHAKEKDAHNPRLPHPEERKKLEPPKPQLRPSSKQADDDIPF
jgi:hypothetical protein